MTSKSLFTLLVSIGMIFLTACNLISGSDKNDSGNANMPNPASVFCEENGGTVDIRTAEDGSQIGICVFPDGSECDEWAFYHGECKPGDSLNMDANMPNPASVFCEENGGTLEIHTAEDGSQAGMCVFQDGSECDEWAYFRGECAPSSQGESNNSPTEFSTPIPINPVDYQGWWKYTHAVYDFSIMLPEDWVVEDISTNDPLLIDHILILHPSDSNETESIRLTFRRTGEDIPLWPTGVGQGEFNPQGTLDVAGQPAQRVLLVCPTGEVTSIWYNQQEGQPNILRDDLEFGFIFSATSSHCESEYSLSGKIQLVGEMIIASLKVPSK
jgi:putative hemolysin